MTTLIAGGCGFIGLNVAQACLERGQNVVLLDRNAPPAAAREAFDALRGAWVHEAVDVTSETAVTDVFQRHAVDEVFYGAAITSGAQREREHPEQVLAVNLLGLAHVIKAAAARGVRRLINLSSGSAYGEGGLARCGATGPLDEAVSRPEPATLYGVTKLASEGMCRRLGALTGLDTVSVRLAIIFGPWELDSGFRDTLSAPMQAGILALGGEAASVSRRDARDWTYSRDVARALLALMAAPGHRHDLYHVSAGRTCSVLDWCEALAPHFPGFQGRLAAPGETPSVELHGDDDRLCMSPRRLAEDIGHTVPGDIAGTAADFAAWMKRFPDYWHRRDG